MPVLTDIGELATCQAGGGQGDAGAIRHAALAWEGEKIVWAGAQADLPAGCAHWDRVSARGRLVVPGLIDCHTHLLFAGSREREFAQLIGGSTYADISASGGGILATVDATRRMDKESLKKRAAGWLAGMLREGVTTVEVKSGYGLDGATEMRMLEAVRELGGEQALELVPTYLGAHVLPREFAGRREDYARRICEEWLPEIAQRGLARFCDAYIEQGAFTAEEVRSIFTCARSLGMGIKVHAEQFTRSGGAALAAEFGAVSADHLEFANASDIAGLKASGTVAVNLPLAMLLACPGVMTPVRALINAGVPVAVATDFNPGSAPCPSLLQAMWLACVVQRMTPAEVLKGVTLNAAMALGLQGSRGSLEQGKLANFCIIEAGGVEEWFYHFDARACRRVFIKGKEVVGNEA